MLRVFLVDDEPAVREMLRNEFPWAKCGFSVAGEADDGGNALPLIRQTRPDILITDICMPNMDGLALSRLVRREFPQMKIIIISACDDFESAQQAVEIGVERYLRKPVSVSGLMTALDAVREKIEAGRFRQEYLTQAYQDTRGYEHYVRRRFLEQIVTRQLSEMEIQETAKQLDMDLQAQAYTIAFVSAVPERQNMTGAHPEADARIRDNLTAYFLKYPAYILFRWDVSTYAVIIKADTGLMDGLIRRCVSTVREVYHMFDPERSWHIAVGKPVRHLQELPVCFEEASRLWAYRYMLPYQNILMEETVRFMIGTGSNHALTELDLNRLRPDVIKDVLKNSGGREVSDFVDGYLRGMDRALTYGPFCQYLMLSVRFAAEEFVDSLNIPRKELLSTLSGLDMVEKNVTVDDLKRYLSDILRKAIELRDAAAESRYRGLLQDALRYIDANFSSGEISLNRVAAAVNVSPSYLSAVFSEETGMTFVEYLTAKRMEKARELLRSTKLRSGEVALAVGYKDPHYFSFLFRKTQGCTPRDYRAGRNEQ